MAVILAVSPGSPSRGARLLDDPARGVVKGWDCGAGKISVRALRRGGSVGPRALTVGVRCHLFFRHMKLLIFE
jgi:hypothetical protein